MTLSSSSSSHAGEGFLFLQIILFSFLNCGLMQFSLMCEADGNQSAFSSVRRGWGEQINAVYYSVRFSKLRINDIFTCVIWRMDSGRGEHRSSADCQWQPLLSYITALFLRWLFTRADYCAAWLCPPHPSASPPPSPLGKAFFVSANLQVQFSELRFNEIFYCMGWRMELISLPQRGKRMRRADQCCILLLLLLLLFSAVF